MPTTHGYATRKNRHPTYSIWLTMIARCHCPTSMGYPSYGARGIRVCERWRTFEHFLADMGARPPGTSIDRINNDGDYEPDNCRWATKKEQDNNRRTTQFLEVWGIRRPIMDWARRVGVSVKTIRQRLKMGWPPEFAIYMPHWNRYKPKPWLNGRDV